jgi:serine/threonine protein phosphatase PrpC
LAQVDGIPAQILVVCDGVSSSDQPDLASRTAAESTCQYLTTIREDELPAAVITSSVAHALKSVCDIPLRPGVNADSPSTTLVTAVVMNGIATIGWLGDSRAYWISDHSCQQLTTDHSWVTEAVAAGEMTLEEAEKSPYAHAITRWIGVDAVTDPIPSILNFVIPHPGYILLCTDGLWNYAPEAQDLAELVKQSSGKDAITISRFLVEFARNQGGHDNITVGILIV